MSQDLQTLPTSSRCQPPTSCRKHPNSPCCYFVSDQPWVQLCEKCALNMALCGKKIERRLSEDERIRKLELEGLALQMRAKGKFAEERELELKARIAVVEAEFLVQVEGILRLYDDEIQEWTRKRNQVYKVYSEEILDYFKTLEDIRYKYSMSAIEIKNSLQNVENNFVGMIHDMPMLDYSEQIEQYKKTLQKVVDNQDKIGNFQRKRQTFNKIVEQLVAKTQAFKAQKQKVFPTNSTIPISINKFRPLDGGQSRKHDSTTPTRKLNINILQDHNGYKDQQLKLRLKPSQATSTSKSKLTDRARRTISKPVRKQDFDSSDIGRHNNRA